MGNVKCKCWWRRVLGQLQIVLGEVKWFPDEVMIITGNSAWSNEKALYKSNYYYIIMSIYPGGGPSHWKGVWGCAAVMTPFFETSHRSLAYQFTINALLLCPLFSIFRKFLHFQPSFGQNSSSLDPNFSKFLFLRPLFFKENLLPRPYILKPAWHTSTKKKGWVPPPPPGIYPVDWYQNATLRAALLHGWHRSLWSSANILLEQL